MSDPRLDDLPELSPTEKALADELGPNYADHIMVSAAWMKKGGWRPRPDDLAAELKAADAAGCVLLVAHRDGTVLHATDEHCGDVGVEQYGARWTMLRAFITACCWHPKYPDPPNPKDVK